MAEKETANSTSTPAPDPEDLPQQEAEEEAVEEKASDKEEGAEETTDTDESETEDSETEADEEAESEEDEGDSETEPEVELVEVERGGVKYQIPKALEGELLMQGDYTRKTQALAEEKKAFEEQQKQFQEQTKFQSEHMDDFVELGSIDRELEKFGKVDWDKAQEEDPEQAQRAFRRYTLLRDQRNEVRSRMEKRAAEASEQAQRDYATALGKAREYAAREIKDWSPELESKLADFTGRHGIDADFVRQAAAAKPEALKIIHLAYLGEQFLKEQSAALKAKPKPKPVKTVKKPAGRSAPPRGPRDDQDVKDWLAERHRQLAARAGR